MRKQIFLVLPWFLVLLLGGVVLLQFQFKNTPFTPQLTVSSTPSVLSTAPGTRLPVGLPDNETSEVGDTLSLVIRVIDGDTIEIDDPQARSGRVQLRYIGIDTPEQGMCLGDVALQKNKDLVEWRAVRLEKDISEVDKYGRLLRYVWVDELMVNEELVRAGFAKVSTFPPDVKYVNRLLQAEKEAKGNQRGLWSPDACKVQGALPAQAGQEPNNQIAPSAGCLIKGNISTKGEKIYHLPGCGSYEKTVINAERGERWFCSEEEALSAGWRKAKNCP